MFLDQRHSSLFKFLSDFIVALYLPFWASASESLGCSLPLPAVGHCDLPVISSLSLYIFLFYTISSSLLLLPFQLSMACLVAAGGSGVNVSSAKIRVKELSLELFTGLDVGVRGVQFHGGCLGLLLSKKMLLTRADANQT